jgi:hypothetical protein
MKQEGTFSHSFIAKIVLILCGIVFSIMRRNVQVSVSYVTHWTPGLNELYFTYSLQNNDLLACTVVTCSNVIQQMSPCANVSVFHGAVGTQIHNHDNRICCPWKKIPWPVSEREICRPSDRRLSAKLVPTFVDRLCHVVSVTDRYGRNLGFLDRNRYFFFQVALLLRKPGSAGNRTRTSGSVARNCDH